MDNNFIFKICSVRYFADAANLQKYREYDKSTFFLFNSFIPVENYTFQTASERDREREILYTPHEEVKADVVLNNIIFEILFSC